MFTHPAQAEVGGNFLLLIVHLLTNASPSPPLLHRFMHRNTRPSPIVRCRLLDGVDGHAAQEPQAADHRSEARLRIDAKVLVFVETTYSRLGRDIAELLVYNRMK